MLCAVSNEGEGGGGKGDVRCLFFPLDFLKIIAFFSKKKKRKIFCFVFVSPHTPPNYLQITSHSEVTQTKNTKPKKNHISVFFHSPSLTPFFVPKTLFFCSLFFFFCLSR